MTEQGPSTVNDPPSQACSACGDTTRVQPVPGISPRVKAWSYTACQTTWAITTVNPQSYCDYLTATVEQLSATRSALGQVITLADDAATLSDKQLRDRLLTIADRTRLAQRPLALTNQVPEGVKLLPAKTPAGRRLSGVRPRALPGLPAAGRFHTIIGHPLAAGRGTAVPSVRPWTVSPTPTLLSRDRRLAAG